MERLRHSAVVLITYLSVAFLAFFATYVLISFVNDQWVSLWPAAPEKTISPPSPQPSVKAVSVATPTPHAAAKADVAPLQASPTPRPLPAAPTATPVRREAPSPTSAPYEDPTSTPEPARLSPPAPEETPTPQPAREPTSAPTSAPRRLSHVVRQGETLFTIATSYGITVAELAAANSIGNQDLVFAGQVLVIPLQGAPPGEDPPQYVTHIVQRGESLYTVANRYNTTAAQLARLNGLGDIDRIYAGQALRVPKQ